MMNGALMSDWIKMRKTWIPLLVILGPFCVVGLNAMRYALSHGAVIMPGDDTHNWALLIQNTDHLFMPTLILGVALLVSMLSGIDHQGHAWKQLLALPVSRTQVYVSKFIWIAGLLAVSATLCAIGTLCIGLTFGFSTHVAWLPVLYECFYPYFAAYGIIAIQLLISILFVNQAFAITLGVVGMIISGLSDAITPDSLAHAWHVAIFIPWVYPSLSAITHGTVQYLDVRYVISGLVMGLVVVGLGCVLFAKREVK